MTPVLRFIYFSKLKILKPYSGLTKLYNAIKFITLFPTTQQKIRIKSKWGGFKGLVYKLAYVRKKKKKKETNLTKNETNHCFDVPTHSKLIYSINS